MTPDPPLSVLTPPDDACLVVNKEYKFYLVDEKGVKSNKSGLLIAEGTGTGVSEQMS